MALIVVVLSACSATTVPVPEPSLEPLLLPDRTSPVLFRPRGIAVTGDGERIVVVEEGRRTLTTLDPATRQLQRRPLWPGRLDESLDAGPTHEFGTLLVRAEDGYWTNAPGLGPLFVSDDDTQKPTVLGGGAGGLPPRDGLDVERAALNDVRGLCLDEQGYLLLAVADAVFRIRDQQLELIADRLGIEGTPIELGVRVGLAVDSLGQVFVTDAGTQRVWRIARDGASDAVAGGGSALSAPTEPVPADSLALELGQDQLTWDDVHGELLLLRNGTLFVIRLDTVDGHTIHTLVTGAPRPVGLTLYHDQPTLSAVVGSIHAVTDEGPEVLYDASDEAVPGLGRSTALALVGTGALAVQDPALRRLWVWVPGVAPAVFWAESSALAPPPQPFTADRQGNVYLVTSRGLWALDLVDGTGGVIAKRVADPVLDGQPVTEITLPADGELRFGPDRLLWMLDKSRGIVLTVELDSGAVTYVAGALSGGVGPRYGESASLRFFKLDYPSSVAVDGSLVVLLDHDGTDGGLVYGMNTGSEPAAAAGREVPAQRAVLLGGAGESAFTDGMDFTELVVSQFRRLTTVQQTLFVSVDDTSSAPLLRVDADGRAWEVPIADRPPPDALAAIDAEVVVMGWRDDPEIAAINLGELTRSELGVDLEPGSLTTITQAEDGIGDLALDPRGSLFALTVGGGVDRVYPDARSLGTTGVETRSLAVADDGGAYVLNSTRLWAVASSGTPTFMGELLPEPPGGAVVEPADGWNAGTRLATMSFSSDVLGMTVASDGSLYWVDGPTRALYRANPDTDGRVAPGSRVDRLSEGEPIPTGSGPVMLELGVDGLFMALADRVFRFGDGEWTPFVDPLQMIGISGIAAWGDGLLIRCTAGLVVVERTGAVSRIEPSLATDVSDGSVLSFGQSVDVLDGRPVVIQAGGVYGVNGF